MKTFNSIMIIMFILLIIPGKYSYSFEKTTSNSIRDYKYERKELLPKDANGWNLISMKISYSSCINYNNTQKTGSMGSQVLLNQQPNCCYSNSNLIINLNGINADQILICDLMGTVHTTITRPTEKERILVNVGNYLSGTYFIIFRTESSLNYTLKFIKL